MQTMPHSQALSCTDSERITKSFELRSHCVMASLHSSKGCSGCSTAPWVIDNEEKLTLLFQVLIDEPIVAIDTETYGIDPTSEAPGSGRGNIFCWSLAYVEPSLGRNARGGFRARGVFLPAWGPWGAYLLAQLKPWLEDPCRAKIGHNLYGFDRHMFANYGIQLAGIHDTLTISRLNDPGGPHGLKHLVRELLGYEFADYKDLFRRRKRGALQEDLEPRRAVRTVDGTKLKALYYGAHTAVYAGYEQIPLNELGPEHLDRLVTYSTLDAIAVMELWPVLQDRLLKRGLRKTYSEVWRPLCRAISHMEGRGWQVDKSQLETSAGKLRADIASLRNVLDDTFGVINYNSPPQMKNLLYGKLGLEPPPFRGSGNAARRTRDGEEPTDEIAIKNLIRGPNDPLNEVLALKRRTKELQLVESIIGHVRPNGRVYCSLAPRTETGRLSCRNPNLQQIPKRDKYSMRKAFGAPSWLVVADFSQLELYVIAHYAKVTLGDESLIMALNADDVHTYIAKVCWPHLPDVADLRGTEHARYRDIAKSVTYGIAYGKQAAGLGAQILDESGRPIGKAAAQEILDRYNRALPAIPALKAYFVEECRKNGGSRTLLNRWRALPNIDASDDYERWGAERQAVNTPIQGTAADVVALAMLRVEDLQGCDLIAQIHDELVVETDDPEPVAIGVRECMEGSFPGMLLHADVKMVRTWGEAK